MPDEAQEKPTRKGKGGAPKWSPDEKVRKTLLAAYGMGFTIEQLASLAGSIDQDRNGKPIAESTFYAFKKRNREFSEALKREKARSGIQAAQTLYALGMGSHKSQDIRVTRTTRRKSADGKVETETVTETKGGRPDTGALIFWLKSQMKWTDRVSVESATGEAARRITVSWGKPPVPVKAGKAKTKRARKGREEKA